MAVAIESSWRIGLCWRMFPAVNAAAYVQIIERHGPMARPS